MVNTTKLVDSRVYKALNMAFSMFKKCPLWPVPLHFRNASAASDYVYIIPILIKRVQTLSLRMGAKGTV